MSAHLDIQLGADLTLSATWYTNKSAGTIKDLTGYTARMQFRPLRTSDIVILDMSTVDGGIVLGANLAGHIQFVFTDTLLANINPQTAEWDCVFLDGSGNYSRPLRGSAEFLYAITPTAIA